jgi:hypothetical protein
MAVNEKPLLEPLPCCAVSQPVVNIAAVNLERGEHRCVAGRLRGRYQQARGRCDPREEARRNGGAFNSPRKADASLQVGAID